MGLGSIATLTPTTTGRLLVIATGGVFSATAGASADAVFTIITRGTGTAPVNGAALTGTQISATEQYTLNGTNFVEAFSINAIVTGLSVGVATWFDIALRTGSASITVALLNVNITVIEF